MLAVLRRNPVALGLAILLHIALAVFLILEVDWRDQVKPIGADVVVVQAELVDQRKLEAAAQKHKDAEAAKAAAARRAEQQRLEQRRAEEKRKLAAIEKKREQEEARKKAEEQKRIEAEKVRLAEKKRKEEEKKKAEEKKRKAELDEKRRLEEQKRKDEEAARAKKEAEEKAKREAEAKRKAEAEEKAKREAEAKRKAEAEEKAEAERKRKAEAKARADRKAREAELAAQIAAEQDASELQQVIGLIQQKIERNWLRPPGTEGLKCELKVRLGSSGSVLLVRVVKSSGNVAFDRSVEAAVRKADPLPMPRSERLLARFRGDVNFIFDPSN